MENVETHNPQETPEQTAAPAPRPKKTLKFYGLLFLGGGLLVIVLFVNLRSSASPQVLTANASNQQTEREEGKKQQTAVESIENAYSQNPIPAPGQTSPAPMGKQEKSVEGGPFDNVRISTNSPVADALNATAKPTDSTRPADPPPSSYQPVTGGSATQPTPRETKGPESTPTRQMKSGYFFGREPDAPAPSPVAASNVNAVQPPTQNPPFVQRYSGPKPEISKPNFGALLPVRLLGSLLTLGGQNLVRCEITRDVQGKGWKLQRGTQFIGEIRETVGDRVFIHLNGYIDPKENNFIPLKCDLLGSDGASGLPGERKRLNSRFSYLLGRLFDAGVNLGQAALSRGNSVIVPTGQDLSILTGVNSSSGTQAQTYLRINANIQGYALVTEIPGQAESGTEGRGEVEYQLPGVPTNAQNSLASPQEMALLESATTEAELRAILPKLNPRLREVVLNALQRQ